MAAHQPIAYAFGMSKIKDHVRLDAWPLVESLLPAGWREQAKTLGALRRARQIRDPATLLRVLLIHLADGCSLVETAVRATELKLCELSDVAVLKRLRAGGEWLNWMCRGLWASRGRRLANLDRRVRAVDSTMVVETGETGTQWRVHYSLNLSDLRCDYFEVTSADKGESLAKFPVLKGDVLVGDRGLAIADPIGGVIARGGDVLVRASLHNLPMYSPNHERFRPLAKLRRLRVGAPAEWPAWLRTKDGRWIVGRMIAIRRSARSAAAAQRRVNQKARGRGTVASAQALEAALYMTLWTSLSAKELDAAEALRLYRQRWQIELSFKRSKSILGLGQLPKHSDESSRAWLHGKLLVALLIERLIVEADSFSPWGYPLEANAQPMAGNQVHGA